MEKPKVFGKKRSRGLATTLGEGWLGAERLLYAPSSLNGSG